MKIDYPVDQCIELLREHVKTVDSLLGGNVRAETASAWKDKSIQTLKRILGDGHSYVQDFASISFATPFMDGREKILLEDTFRLALEDGKSYIVALIDELESEYHSAFGIMDMESLFAEMNRYVSHNIDDKRVKDNLQSRITRLRDGMIAGDISGDEITTHVRHISDMDAGLFERIVPLLTWYYMHRDGVNEVSNS